MLKILTEIYTKGKYASFYFDCDDLCKFVYGKIIAINSKEIAIYMFSLDGEYDGILIQAINKIVRIECDGQYDSKMQKLILANQNTNSSITLDVDDIKTSTLLLAYTSKRVVSLEILDSGFNGIIGIVEEFLDDVCNVKLIDDYGQEDGYTYVPVENITAISYDSQDERRIQKLWLFNIS